MAKKKAAPEVPLETTEEALLDQVDLDSTIETMESLADSFAAPPEPTELIPAYTDPQWADWVMSQFRDDEMDPSGRPLVYGLRRLTQLLLGPVVLSLTDLLESPRLEGGIMSPAVARCHIKVLFCRDTATPYEVECSDVADCFAGNTDPAFARFPSAMAATRAEARCLRKLLRLRGAAAEEMASVPLESTAGCISKDQLNFINVLCRRCNIDAMKFINAGKQRYQSPQEINYQTAVRMVEHLSGLQNDPSKIPTDMVGFVPDWLETFS